MLTGCPDTSFWQSVSSSSRPPRRAQQLVPRRERLRLYIALLTTSFADSELPTGFSSAKVGLSTSSQNGLRYHVVGEVAVNISGPDTVDAILYYVYPNATDALDDFLHPNRTATKVTVMGKVPGYKLPSEFLNGSITGKNSFGVTVTNGVTGMDVLTGSVIVAAATTSTANTESANVPGTLALLKAGLNHLRLLQRRG